MAENYGKFYLVYYIFKIKFVILQETSGHKIHLSRFMNNVASLNKMDSQNIITHLFSFTYLLKLFLLI